MSFLLEDENFDYEIFFVHQCDERPFNRGAMRNIGFLAAKEKYPEEYKDFIFVFNDIDTVPFKKLFDYYTVPGQVKHYYGFTHTLGGIVVFRGIDFERVQGYPNFWGWGNEDNLLQKRCLSKGIYIDRSHFYPIGSPQILQLYDGIKRLVSQDEHQSTHSLHSNKQIDSFENGLDTLTNISFKTIENMGPLQNSFMINVFSFSTQTQKTPFWEHDIRESNVPWNSKHVQPQMQIKTKTQMQEKTKTKTQMNPFSPEYASYIGIKPRALKSVNIDLGGVTFSPRLNK
jgi:hypothetical protein